jgi:hypothetical protein
MDTETKYAINDLLDAVEALTELVQELNPGATNQIGRIHFLLSRTQRVLREELPKR